MGARGRSTKETPQFPVGTGSDVLEQLPSTDCRRGTRGKGGKNHRVQSTTMRAFALLLVGLFSLGGAMAFGSRATTCHVRVIRRHSLETRVLRASDDENLDELTPPSISFTRNSILFGENAPSQKDNGPLWVWKQTKSALPPFVTGAWDENKGDKRPVEHLYNFLFIRLPTVGAALLYLKNILTGHPLIMSFGSDTMFEVPPPVVFGVIFFILR